MFKFYHHRYNRQNIMKLVYNWLEKNIKMTIFHFKKFENSKILWRKQSHIVVHKYIGDLTETQMSSQRMN